MALWADIPPPPPSLPHANICGRGEERREEKRREEESQEEEEKERPQTENGERETEKESRAAKLHERGKKKKEDEVTLTRRKKKVPVYRILRKEPNFNTAQKSALFSPRLRNHLAALEEEKGA